MGNEDVDEPDATLGRTSTIRTDRTGKLGNASTSRLDRHGISKAPTGILGLDEILNGGLPKARPTLLCGGPGCGKTMLAMEFICRGALEFGEPGVVIAFEEKAAELSTNMASLGYNLSKLQADGLVVIDFVPLDPEQIVESGSYDLEGLFIRIAASVKAIGAKRIAIDTIEVLFGALKDFAIIRSELKRLFTWTKDMGLTALITAESGDGNRLSRNGIEEYVSDCVILLDHRIREEHSTRRLRVIKYRGSDHGSDEYPFLISNRGFVVLPITSIGLNQTASTTRVPTGITRLDQTLSGGFYKGSSVLISGNAGTGKTTFAAHFANQACADGNKTLFISYEESGSQLERNMASAGIKLAPWVEQGLLRLESLRATRYGTEAHLAWLEQILEEFEPTSIVVDPITSFLRSGSSSQTSSMLLREIDLLKSKGITAFYTSLTHPNGSEETEVDVSSLIDTWLIAKTAEINGERNRVLYIVKSRGMNHSNQLTEFTITAQGIKLLEPYVGPRGVLTGSARMAQEIEDQAEEVRRNYEIKKRELALEHETTAIAAKIASLQAKLASDRSNLDRLRNEWDTFQNLANAHRRSIGVHRWWSSSETSDTDAKGPRTNEGEAK